MPSVSYISVSLPFWAKGALSLFENKTPTMDQPEQHRHKENFECSFITAFFPPLFVSLLDVWGCVCALYKAPLFWQPPCDEGQAFQGMPCQLDHGTYRNVTAAWQASQGLQELGLKGHFSNSFPFWFTLRHVTHLNPCVERCPIVKYSNCHCSFSVSWK